jgi:hypothetical protein
VNPAPLPLKGANTHMVLRTWPSWIHRGDLPEAMMDGAGKMVADYRYSIPVAWSSAMQYESFWHDEVKKYGRKSFKAPRILRAEPLPSYLGLVGRIYNTNRMQIDQDITPLLKRSYQHTLAQWQLRSQRWSEMRSPWYPIDYRLWSLTPWSWISGRAMINNFRLAHSQKNLPRCLAYARELIDYWLVVQRLEATPEENPIMWLFVAIGQLMLATIPRLPQDTQIIRPAKPVENFPNSKCPLEPHLISSTGTIKIPPRRLEDLITRINTRKATTHPAQCLKHFVKIFYPGAVLK